MSVRVQGSLLLSTDEMDALILRMTESEVCGECFAYVNPTLNMFERSALAKPREARGC